MAVEIRARAATKAHAVRSLMAESPFMGRFPIYVGDDRTDEEGIRAVHAMGGIGFLVDVAFDGHPQQVRRWLHAIGRGDHTTEAR
jgi:trehalose 6-phosphate phosphatase